MQYLYVRNQTGLLIKDINIFIFDFLGKDLPQSLTLSQLLHVLSDYALLPSTLALQFVIRLKTAGSNSMKGWFVMFTFLEKKLF